MTHTSTEHRARRFRRALIGTIAALALSCAALGTAAILQGPKITGWRLDTAAATAGPGQQLRIILDESLAPVRASQVSVTPHVPATVQVQSDILIVQLAGALDHATDYRVVVHGIASSRGGPHASVDVRFRTPALGYTFLRRGPDTDRIFTSTLGGRTRQIYQAPGIQSFVPVSGALVIASTTPDRQSALSVIDPRSTNAETIALPDVGRIQSLTALGNRILFTFTSTGTATPIPRYDRTLFTLDLGASHIPQPVLGLDGQPFDADDWEPVPGSTALILHGIDGSIVRYTPLDTRQPLTPIGFAAELGGLSPDQKYLGANNVSGPLSIQLSNSRATPITPTRIDGRDTYGGVPAPLDEDHQIVLLSVSPEHDGDDFASVLGITGPGPTRILYAPTGPAPLILNYRLTPSGQYAAIEVQPQERQYDPDGSPVNLRPQGVRTDIVEARTGRLLAQQNGFDAIW